jgi:hypothetical protein
MLALSRSLLNREYNLMNVLKALASIISMCNLHVILLSKITPRYFTLFTTGMFRPLNVTGEKLKKIYVLLTRYTTEIDRGCRAM